MSNRLLSLCVAALALAGSGAAAAQTKLLRFPDVYGHVAEVIESETVAAWIS